MGTDSLSGMSETQQAVQQRYAKAAEDMSLGGAACCGDGADCCTPAGGYSVQDLQMINLSESVSLGCGNPTLLAALNPGETVLDLGSGGGMDVLLSARRVGPSGTAIGLDLTDEMLTLARDHATQASATNVEFLAGRIEDIPLPDDA